MALYPGLPGWAGTRMVKSIWILLKQEAVSDIGISWAICKFAPRSRQITMPAPHHSVFTGRMPFLPPNQHRQGTEGSDLITCSLINNIIIYTWRRFFSLLLKIDHWGIDKRLFVCEWNWAAVTMWCRSCCLSVVLTRQMILHGWNSARFVFHTTDSPNSAPHWY